MDLDNNSRLITLLTPVPGSAFSSPTHLPFWICYLTRTQQSTVHWCPLEILHFIVLFCFTCYKLLPVVRFFLCNPNCQWRSNFMKILATEYAVPITETVWNWSDNSNNLQCSWLFLDPHLFFFSQALLNLPGLGTKSLWLLAATSYLYKRKRKKVISTAQICKSIPPQTLHSNNQPSNTNSKTVYLQLSRVLCRSMI